MNETQGPCLGIVVLVTSHVKLTQTILAGIEPFPFPMVAFWGTQDRRISESMVQKWQAFTSENLTVHKIEGNHLWPLAAAAKSQWLQMIAEDLKLIRGA